MNFKHGLYVITYHLEIFETSVHDKFSEHPFRGERGCDSPSFPTHSLDFCFPQPILSYLGSHFTFAILTSTEVNFNYSRPLFSDVLFNL